ncbi:MAG: hypothetical protein COT34_02385 [Candidatus Nealsonbacteria bacterium CG08_land_8_20_14_0_20_43_11]|uniref:Uncharacterized protein n=1 Tax=Candidatus Nealsonbacteria bacterium CG08_land_8_20_14_0_20_43_11 TaxID=1974706 RepID=A0A2M6T0J2_9BACT|nr:MAG: hypothetical protein COT34_02385 [Candidatus Nealsonbacteria bacterium CG08_land_8_20_14_0_20_43_11]
MKSSILKNKFKLFLAFSLFIFLIIGFNLFLSEHIKFYVLDLRRSFVDEQKNIRYNKLETALAQEREPINCKKQVEISLPAGITFELGPNEFELPIGEAVDETGAMGERIKNELENIIGAIDEEIVAAEKIVEYAGECSLTNCSTSGCHNEEQDCNPHLCIIDDPLSGICFDKCTVCIRPHCGGQACPHGNEISAELAAAQAASGRIGASQQKIENEFTKKEHRPIGQWWCNCLLSVLQCAPTPGECRSTVQLILDKLEKSRSGDYEFFNLIPPEFRWNHKPLGLNDCLIKPEDSEAVLRGEKTFHFLSSCRQSLENGFLDECYGQAECENEVSSGRQPPPDWNCPRLDNYYCCE